MTKIRVRFTQSWCGWPKGSSTEVDEYQARKLAAYTERVWKPEDLERLSYIGPLRELALARAGVVSLDQLANLTPAQRQQSVDAGAGISETWLDRWQAEARELVEVRDANDAE